jgi:16S rRNA C967 or C1407 C5-methylase (RsmB/RsmF family)
VDAPCSGSGLFRKDPRAIEEWSEQNVELCSSRQRRILSDILPALKEGGILIYSTCSYSTAENEAVCDWLIKNFPLSTIQYQVKKEWNIIETIAESNAYGYRFYPDKLKGEGFFIAAFRKEGVAADNDRHETKSKSKAGIVTAKRIGTVKAMAKKR